MAFIGMLILSQSGCGTVASYTVMSAVDARAKNPFIPPHGVPIYSGTRVDILMIGTNFSETPEHPWSILAFFDLPISFGIDTAIFPITLIWWLITPPIEKTGKEKQQGKE